MSKRYLHFNFNQQHQDYVNNLNELLKQVDKEIFFITTSGRYELISELTEEIRYNGKGNVINEFFWQGLTPIG